MHLFYTLKGFHDKVMSFSGSHNLEKAQTKTPWMEMTIESPLMESYKSGASPVRKHQALKVDLVPRPSTTDLSMPTSINEHFNQFMQTNYLQSVQN